MSIEDGVLNIIFSRITNHYGIEINSFEELKLGADKKTYTYKIDNGNTKYFLKIRSNRFNKLSIVTPNFLSEEKSIENIIKPIKTLDGKLYIRYSTFYICLYPSYYRFERIIEDIKDYDHQLIDPSKNKTEKINIINTLESQFDKNNVVDMAFKTLSGHARRTSRYPARR